ncbi:MAG TPA: BON domain-containing protein [Terriglobia bacterium]|nr:BON domain-containing protein [Terriglobia bacterium]
MKNKRSVALFMGMLVVAMGLATCSQVRNDADVTADVQARIQQDAALQAASITVQTNSGVVVLSGNVENGAARSLAENVARQVDGVKAVVNNLQVASAAVKLPSTQPRQAARPGGAKRSSKQKPAMKPAQAAAAESQTAAVPPASPVAAAQPAQAAPVKITIPEGTNLTVRLIDPVDTARNKEGDTFRASLDSPVVIQDKTIVPKNANAEVKLVSARSAGHFKGTSAAVLVLSSLTVGGKAYDVQTGEFSKTGASRGKRSAIVVGGGSALGAVVGAIAGGGKGAAVGAAAGAGAGAGVQALTKGQQIKLPSETLLEFQLKAPLTVTPVSGTAQAEIAG